MSNIGVKAGSNVFYLRRSEASKANQKLCSREGAAEEMSIDKGRLFRIENGVALPYPEEVVLMSQLYSCPELENYFCTECCPLGHDVPKVSGNSIDRIAIEAINTFKRIDTIKDTMIEVALEQGKADQHKLYEVFEVLDEICRLTTELKTWARKNMR